MDNCLTCGSGEFITQPNSYDIYTIESGQLILQRSEYTDEQIKLFCRECGVEKKIKN